MKKNYFTPAAVRLGSVFEITKRSAGLSGGTDIEDVFPPVLPPDPDDGGLLGEFNLIDETISAASAVESESESSPSSVAE